MPNRAFLKASLALWRRRLAYRERRHRFYHYSSKRPEEERQRLATKWHKLANEASAMVAKRKRQLARRTPRATAVAWARAQVGITENPPGSNRGGKITDWQRALGEWLVGTPWCGSFVAAALRRAGVKGVTWRLASVAYIEDDARAGRPPFRSWGGIRGSLRGDLVVIGGRGVHVELLVETHSDGSATTIGGNTSPGSGGSQSNGGGVYKRRRSRGEIYGYARVDFPS